MQCLMCIAHSSSVCNELHAMHAAYSKEKLEEKKLKLDLEEGGGARYVLFCYSIYSSFLSEKEDLWYTLDKPFPMFVL